MRRAGPSLGSTAVKSASSFGRSACFALKSRTISGRAYGMPSSVRSITSRYGILIRSSRRQIHTSPSEGSRNTSSRQCPLPALAPTSGGARRVPAAPERAARRAPDRSGRAGRRARKRRVSRRSLRTAPEGRRSRDPRASLRFSPRKRSIAHPAATYHGASTPRQQRRHVLRPPGIPKRRGRARTPLQPLRLELHRCRPAASASSTRPSGRSGAGTSATSSSP